MCICAPIDASVIAWLYAVTVTMIVIKLLIRFIFGK